MSINILSFEEIINFMQLTSFFDLSKSMFYMTHTLILTLMIIKRVLVLICEYENALCDTLAVTKVIIKPILDL